MSAVTLAFSTSWKCYEHAFNQPDEEWDTYCVIFVFNFIGQGEKC